MTISSHPSSAEHGVAPKQPSLDEVEQLARSLDPAAFRAGSATDAGDAFGNALAELNAARQNAARRRARLLLDAR